MDNFYLDYCYMYKTAVSQEFLININNISTFSELE